MLRQAFPRPVPTQTLADGLARSRRRGVPTPDTLHRPMLMITSDELTQARKGLGKRLAAWREAAGLTQARLAQRMGYSRSAVANVEIGRQNIPRSFWQNADRELGAAGSLLAAFDQLDELVQTFRKQVAQERERERQQRVAQYAAHPFGATTLQQECHCTMPAVVARWTGREVRALREALRMSFRAFAKHLGVTAATVSGWERPSRPTPPSLATQAMLDQALTRADNDTKTRFRLLVEDLSDHPCGGRASDVDAGSTVTPLRRPTPPRAVS